MATAGPARAIFQQLHGADLGDWSAARIVAAAAALGWSVDDDTKPTRLETGLPAGPAIVVPSPAEGSGGSGGQDGADGPRIAAVRVPVAEASGFADAVEAATAVAGYPPPMAGGPGPWVRWRRPPGPGGSPGTSFGLLRADGTVWVELVATRTWESQARHWFRTGEGVEELPYRWLARRRHPSLKGLTTGGRTVGDWADVERGIALTAEDLLDDLTALGTPGGPPQGAGVRLCRQGRDATGGVELELGPRHRLALRRTGGEGLDARGWHRREGDTWICEWPDAGPAECAQAAAVAVRTLREDCGYLPPSQAGGRAAAFARPRIAGRGQADLPGLGMGRSRDNG